jgi:iron(III) transport system permease protein
MGASLDVAAAAVTSAPPVPRRAGNREAWIVLGALIFLGLYLVLTIILPLASMLIKSVQNANGEFVGVANFAAYFGSPSLRRSIGNSIELSTIATVITILLAFLYAYCMSRSAMPAKALLKGMALLPLLAPSLLPALSLVYLFGNKGFLKGALLGHSIYGPIGIIIGEVYFAFPHAMLILITALSMADQRLYEASAALRAGRLRCFLTVTLPSCRYGLISASFVVFTLVFTDFGVPKVIGGETNVLATDVYKQVVGQFNFNMGAVVGFLLLTPAIISFAVDRLLQKKQVALLSARAVPFAPKPQRLADGLALAFCAVMAVMIIGILATAAFGSFVTYWPYNLTPTLAHYDFDAIDTNGWGAYRNSLVMASLTAVVGTVLVFSGAYMVEKTRGFRVARSVIQFMCMLPLAVPGLVLGLSYIFFFNSPVNPLNFLYLTMAILVINTVTHFYTVSHLTAVTALKQLDAEFESVSASLKVPFYKTFWRVTVPVCLPAIIDIAVYFFVNAMTTVSAVVFLYSPATKLAAISILNLDDAGKTPEAAAMGMIIVVTSGSLRWIQSKLTQRLTGRAQAWRRR